MYWSAAYAVHGLAGSACSPVKVGSQRLHILNIPVSIQGFRASSRFWPHLRTAQENWRCPSTTIITRDRAPTTVSPVSNRCPQSGLVHQIGLRYPLRPAEADNLVIPQPVACRVEGALCLRLDSVSIHISMFGGFEETLGFLNREGV